jgi:single-strand DNA-binding protein
MRDVNKVILVGRLGADPVKRETRNGIPVVHFPVATGRKVKSGPEEGALPIEQTQWHQVVAWGKQGLACAAFLRKGNSVYVEGALLSRKYTDKEGEERVSFEIQADQVSFLGRSGRVGIEQMAQEATPA